TLLAPANASTPNMLRSLRPLFVSSLIALAGACAAVSAPVSSTASHASASATDDPYLWLEDVTAERSLDWARAHNAKSSGELVDADFHALEARLKAILDSNEKIPYVTKIGALYYNLWQDAKN